MADAVYLGRYSLLLLLGVLNGWVLAVLLARVPRNRAASRLLAGLVALIGWRLMPYVLGFAGVYDHWWALTFFPFDLSLAFGPLLWAYVAHLTTGRRPARWGWHLVPAAGQLVGGLVGLAQPLARKWAWYTGPYLHTVAPIEAALSALSLLVYTGLAWRQVRRWHRWLDDHESEHERLRLRALERVLVAVGVVGLLATGFAVAPAFGASPSYIDRFPLMVALAALAYGLGLVGWRLGGQDVPTMAPDANPADRPLDLPAGTQRAGVDYAALGSEWQARIEAEGWHRDPDLTLATLAERLGTSPRTLSRVLAEGLGVRFHPFVNALRAREAAAALADPADARGVLEIGLAAGFASKASFNRAFRAHTGQTPTAVRRARPDLRHPAPLA